MRKALEFDLAQVEDCAARGLTQAQAAEELAVSHASFASKLQTGGELRAAWTRGKDRYASSSVPDEAEGDTPRAKVLRAIVAGIKSRPEIKGATELDYSKINEVLGALELERKVEKVETPLKTYWRRIGSTERPPVPGAPAEAPAPAPAVARQPQESQSAREPEIVSDTRHEPAAEVSTGVTKNVTPRSPRKAKTGAAKRAAKKGARKGAKKARAPKRSTMAPASSRVDEPEEAAAAPAQVAAEPAVVVEPPSPVESNGNGHAPGAAPDIEHVLLAAAVEFDYQAVWGMASPMAPEVRRLIAGALNGR